MQKIIFMKVPTKTILIILSVVSVIIIASAAIFINSYYEENLSLKSPLTKTDNENMAKFLTEKAIDEYVFTSSLEVIQDNLVTNFADGASRYVFVIDFDTLKIVSHPNSEIIGQYVFDEIDSKETPQQVKDALTKNGTTWMHYHFTNPDDNKVESKISWLKLQDGLIFGSGFYVSEPNAIVP